MIAECSRQQAMAVTFRAQVAVLGPGDITLKVGSRVLPLGLEVAGASGGTPTPRPELAVWTSSTALLTGFLGGLGVVRANLGVVTEVRRVLLVTETVRGGAQVTRGTV